MGLFSAARACLYTDIATTTRRQAIVTHDAAYYPVRHELRPFLSYWPGFKFVNEIGEHTLYKDMHMQKDKTFKVFVNNSKLQPVGCSGKCVDLYLADAWFDSPSGYRLSRLRVFILSRVRGSVTNNNEFWIGWLDLLTILRKIIINTELSLIYTLSSSPLHTH
jgi:hypothetical protein